MDKNIDGNNIVVLSFVVIIVLIISLSIESCYNSSVKKEISKMSIQYKIDSLKLTK